MSKRRMVQRIRLNARRNAKLHYDVPPFDFDGVLQCQMYGEDTGTSYDGEGWHQTRVSEKHSAVTGPTALRAGTLSKRAEIRDLETTRVPEIYCAYVQ